MGLSGGAMRPVGVEQMDTVNALPLAQAVAQALGDKGW